jgi:hypothetical protein
LAARTPSRLVVSQPGLRVVDLTEAFCPRGRCPVLSEDVIRFIDARHISRSFSLALAPILGRKLLDERESFR